MLPRNWTMLLAGCVLAWHVGLPDIVRADGRQDYRELARFISQDYLLSGSQVEADPSLAAIERLSKGSGEKEVQRAATLIAKGLELAADNTGSAARAIKDAERRAGDTLDAAGRGEFTRKEVYYDYDDRGNLRKREVEIDESLLPVATSLGAMSLTREAAPEMEAIRRRIALDGSRIRAWDEVLPTLAERFSGPLTNKPLVAIEYLNDGPNGRPLPQTPKSQIPFMPSAADTFRGRFVAKNVANRDLHNVTLLVDMYHFSTLPEVTLRHVYFIPEWKPGSKLEFSRSFLVDLKRGGKKYKVRALETDGPYGPPIVNPELSRMAGVVRMEATLWSDEARQSPTRIELPARASIVAATLVKLAENRATSQYAVTGEKRPDTPIIQKMKADKAAKGEKEPTGKSAEQITQMLLEELLRPVLEIMPADSESAKQAKRLLDDFRSVRKDLLQAKDDSLLGACAAGKRYVGKWSGRAILGEVGLLFISCDAKGKRIRAEFFDPAKPTDRRSVAGYIGIDRRTQKNMIMLQPLGPGPTPPPGRPLSILDDAVQSYRLKLEEGSLDGHYSTQTMDMAGYDSSYLPMTMKETPGDAKEFEEATRRDKAIKKEIKEPADAAAKASPSRLGNRTLPGQPQIPPKGSTKTPKKR